MNRTDAEKLLTKLRLREHHYDRGFNDGLRGTLRGHGPKSYHEGYDDGLDVYDCEHAEEEGWDDIHCQADG